MTKKNNKQIMPIKSSKDELLSFYNDMLLIRRFEEKAGQLYGMGQIAGFCHLYIGQEAVVIGTRASMIEGDQMITGYRDHGHMLACGMQARGVMAELTGRAGGYSRGKGGSMHMFSTEKHFYGGHGIVGAQVPIGAGLALSNKYKNNGNVSLAFLEMALQIKGKYMKHSIWPNYGAYQLFLLLKIISMQWVHL